MDEEIKLPTPAAYMGTFPVVGCKPGTLAHHAHTSLETLKASGPSDQTIQPLFTADQLRAVVAADRAARVVLSDDHIEDLCMELFVTAQGNSPISEKLARIDAIVRRYLSEQPAQQPLSDEQFQKIRRSLMQQSGWDGDGWDQALKEAIEQTHGIGAKND